MEDFIGMVDSGERKITDSGMGSIELMKSNWNYKEKQ